MLQSHMFFFERKLTRQFRYILNMLGFLGLK